MIFVSVVVAVIVVAVSVADEVAGSGLATAEIPWKPGNFLGSTLTIPLWPHFD